MKIEEYQIVGFVASAFVLLIFLIRSSRKKRDQLERQLAETLTVMEEKGKHYEQTLVADRARNEKLMGHLEFELRDLQNQNLQLVRSISRFENVEAERKNEFTIQIAQLSHAYGELRDERQRTLEQEEYRRHLKSEELKRIWQRHERDVQERIQALCLKHQLEYIPREKFPFKGFPDNVIRMHNDFIIFDSKAPESEDPKVFLAYIKAQAELVKKYTEFEEVKKDVFFVVPAQSLVFFKETFLEQNHSRVHVIGPESIENLLLILRKFEDFEFAKGFSPDDRENMVMVLGRFAHSLKRRIQVDQFFIKEFITQLRTAETLPKEILEEAQSVERASRINPPQERRGKRIEVRDLEKDLKKITQELVHQQLNIDVGFEKLEQIPLEQSRDGE